MIHKHDINTAISNLRLALEHVEHHSDKPEIFCLKQLLVNPIAYLLTENIIRVEKEEHPIKALDIASEEVSSDDVCAYCARPPQCHHCEGHHYFKGRKLHQEKVGL